MMTLRDTLDERMRAQLRSRYRPLPPVMPAVMAEPEPEPEPIAKPLLERKLAAVLPPRPIPKGLTIATVLAVAVRVTGVPLAEMRGRSRVRSISHPRQFTYWLLKEKIGMSLSKTAYPLNKNYASVFVGIRKTRRRLAEGVPLFVRWRDEAEEMLG